MYKKFSLSITIILMAFLILKPEVATSTVKESISLWYTKVLPSLFPALILIKIFLSIDLTAGKEHWVCILSGLLCGFPVGATTSVEYIKKGKISVENGLLYATLFNQFSPVFLISYIGMECLRQNRWLPLILIYFSQFILFIFCKKYYSGKKQNFIKPQLHKNETYATDVNYKVVDASILSSCEALIKICGYMVICNLINMLIYEISKNQLIYAIFAPILEVSGGASVISQSSLPEILKYSLLLAGVSFGGVSGILQVNQILQQVQIPIYKYIIIKALSFFVTGIITCIYFSAKTYILI